MREGSQRIARFTVEVQRLLGGESETVALRFADGMKGGIGQPVRNVVSIAGTSHLPALGSCSVLLWSPPPRPFFHRADPSGDGASDLTDAVFILDHLFTGGRAPHCLESADVNNDGALDISDAIAHLGYLFTGGVPPAEPGPSTALCGIDPDEVGSPKDLGCGTYDQC